MQNKVSSMSDGNKLLNERVLCKKLCSKWIMALMYLRNQIEYESNFFECIHFLTNGLKELTNKLINNIKEYNNSHKRYRIPGQQLVNLKTSSKGLLPDALEALIEDYPHILNVVKGTIAQELAENQKSKASLTGKYGPLDSLKRLFSLDNDALELVYFIFLTNTYEPIEDFFRSHLSVFKYENYNLLSEILKINEARCKELRVNLESMGIISTNHFGPVITPEIDRALKIGNSRNLKDILCSPLPACRIPLEEFNIDDHDKNYVIKLLERKHTEPVSILLYGKPGVGKSTFVKALAKTLNAKAFQVACREDDHNADRKASLVACIKMAHNYNNSFVVVDEAEAMLHVLNDDYSFGTTAKAWLTNLMERRGNKIIWIANNISHVPPSIKRRFAYSIYFSDLTPRQQVSMWQKTASRLHVENKLPVDAIKSLVNRYSVPISIIENSIRLAKVVSQKTNLLENIELHLKSYVTLLHNGKKKVAANAEFDDYLVDGINISMPVAEFIAKARRINEYIKSEKAKPAMANFLFSGISGGGKSHLAKYLAHVLEKPLLIKRASDILSKYVGESEQMISEIFKESQNKQALLVIDECESFIFNRESDSRSWELSLVNAFLTCLEEYSGICICTTNTKSIIDMAFLRRFAMKIDFKYALPQQLELLYTRILSPIVGTMPPVEILENLKTHKNLSVGDFINVKNQFWFEEPGIVTHQLLLQALIREERQKLQISEKHMGFAV